jgi:hypothetical protein
MITIVISVDDTEMNIRKALLRKFYRHGIWGAGHMREDNVPKGFQDHLRKKVMEIAEELIRKGILCKKPTSHGIQWYANRDRLEEIEKIINDC